MHHGIVSVSLVALILAPDVFCFSPTAGIIGDDNVPESGCHELLESFAYVSSNFTYCAIREARPIRLCKECITFYLKMRKVYSDIMDLEDTGGEVCKDQLFNLDRLQVVDSGFSYVTKLWGRASCDTCFVLDDKNCPTTELTPEVRNIWNASNELEMCIRDHRNDTLENGLADPKVCFECAQEYENINKLYNDIKGYTGDVNFCMDIVDLINTTRVRWSSELGCCQDRKRPELVFFISSGVITLITVIFYLLVYIFPLDKEKNLQQAPQTRWNVKSTPVINNHPSSSHL